MLMLSGSKGRFGRRPRAALLAVVAGAVGASAAGAQPERERGAPFFVLEHGPLSEMVVSPKDRGLADALAMLPSRVAELPVQTPDMEPDAAEVINTILATVARPMRVAAFYDGDNPAGGFFGYGMVLSVETSGRDEAERLQAHVSGMLAQNARLSSKPSARWSSMVEVQLPLGTLSYGPRRVGDGWRYEVIVGTVHDPDVEDRAPEVGIEGFEPFLHGRFEFSGLTPALTMAHMMAGRPEVTRAYQQMERAGLVGPEAMTARYVAGYAPDKLVTVTVLERARAYVDSLNLATEPLDAASLAAVPSDATLAYLARADLSSLTAALDQAAQNPEVADALAQFKAETGVDLRNDVLGSLGGTAGYYWSDSTGGGHLFSSVVLVSIKDRERFESAHKKLLAYANGLATHADLGPGALKLSPWSDGEIRLASLQFRGLPVPLELTYAITDSWLVVAATPQGALAAARQASGRGDRGLTGNGALARHRPQGVAPVSLAFIDTERFLRGGYPYVSLAGSAVANLVRSPIGERDFGIAVPPYRVLAEGVRPYVKVSYWRGDDLVVESHTDPSLLVNAAALGGSWGQLAPLLAIPAMAAGQHHAAKVAGGGATGEVAGMLSAWDWMNAKTDPARMVAERLGGWIWSTPLGEHAGRLPERAPVGVE